MKNFALMIIFLGIVGINPAHAEDNATDKALDKIFYNAELNRIMSPQDPLWKVISAASWNIQSGAVDSATVTRLRQEASKDNGEVVAYLQRQGYNYHVLERLRWCLGLDVDQVSYGVSDLGQLENTKLGKEPAGIPEFLRLGSEQEGKVNSRGDLVVNYEPQIHYVLEAMRSQIEKAVREANKTPHSIRNLFFTNRHKQIDKLVQFAMGFENLMMEIQAVQGSFRVKMAPLEAQSLAAAQETPQMKKLKEAEAKWQKTKSEVLVWAGNVLKATLPTAKGREAWEPLLKAASSSTTLERWAAKAHAATQQAMNDMDMALDKTSQDQQYSGDTMAELELKRAEHLKEHKTLTDLWDKNSNFSYYRRTHTWPLDHYHSEEHGPYLLKSTETLTRDIYDIDLAPFDEVYIAAKLAEEGERLLERHQQKGQIYATRIRLQSLQQMHQNYVQRGPQPHEVMPPHLAKGFPERFQARNQIISTWIKLLINDSFRQEAHEAMGYIGLDKKTEIPEESRLVLERLGKIAGRLRKAEISIYVGSGVVTGAAICLTYLSHIAR